MSPLQTQQGSDQPMSETHRQDLLKMVDLIKQKHASFEAMKFAADNKSDIARRGVLKDVFDKLQMSGVDLTNRTSVSNFISKLRQDNPEMADRFESAMEALLGSETGGPVPPNMNNKNTNETSSQNLRGRIA